MANFVVRCGLCYAGFPLLANLASSDAQRAKRELALFFFHCIVMVSLTQSIDCSDITLCWLDSKIGLALIHTMIRLKDALLHTGHMSVTINGISSPCSSTVSAAC